MHEMETWAAFPRRAAGGGCKIVSAGVWFVCGGARLGLVGGY